MPFEIPTTVAYKHLMQKHPAYEGDFWRLLDLYYRGGAWLKRAALKPELFGLPQNFEVLLKRHQEDGGLYGDRVRRMHSISYTGTIVDMFASCIFSDTPSIEPKGEGETHPEDEFYAEFADDVDGRGTSLAQFQRQMYVDEAVMGASYVLVDFPEGPAEGEPRPLTQAEEDDIGARVGRFIRVRRPQILDWDRDELGNLNMAIIHNVTTPRKGIGSARDMAKHQWRVIVPGMMAVFEVEAKVGIPIPPEKQISGRVFQTRMETFALVESELPLGLWVGAKIHSVEWESLQKQNALSWAEWTSAFAMLVISATDTEKQSKRGDHGFIRFLDTGDDAKWIEPAGNALGHLLKRLETLRIETFRIANQLPLAAEPDKRQPESGKAKGRDRDPMNRVCMAYGERVWEQTEDALHRLADGRAPGRRDDKIRFETKGLAEFDQDRLRDLREMLSKGEIDKLGEKAVKLARKQIARQFLDASPEELEEIFEEIEAMDFEQEQVDGLRKAVDEMRKGAPEVPPGKKKPPVKPPENAPPK